MQASSTHVNSWADVNSADLTFATIPGTIFTKIIQKSAPQANIRLQEEDEVWHNLVVSGQADVSMDSVIGWNSRQAQRYPELTIAFGTDEPINPIEFAMMLPKNDPEWADYIAEWTRKHINSGFLSSLQDKHKMNPPK